MPLRGCLVPRSGTDSRPSSITLRPQQPPRRTALPTLPPPYPLVGAQAFQVLGCCHRSLKRAELGGIGRRLLDATPTATAAAGTRRVRPGLAVRPRPAGAQIRPEVSAQRFTVSRLETSLSRRGGGTPAEGAGGGNADTRRPLRSTGSSRKAVGLIAVTRLGLVARKPSITAGREAARGNANAVEAGAWDTQRLAERTFHAFVRAASTMWPISSKRSRCERGGRRRILSGTGPPNDSHGAPGCAEAEGARSPST
jgi:hypothetical protein